MFSVEAIIRNEHGIHCRPSALIVKEAMAYDGTITVASATGSCDLKSIIGLISLGLAPRDAVTITVTGPDEMAYAGKLKEMFERHFDFPARSSSESTQTLIANFEGDQGDASR